MKYYICENKKYYVTALSIYNKCLIIMPMTNHCYRYCVPMPIPRINNLLKSKIKGTKIRANKKLDKAIIVTADLIPYAGKYLGEAWKDFIDTTDMTEVKDSFDFFERINEDLLKYTGHTYEYFTSGRFKC